MFLKIGVDARDGDANPAIALLHASPEDRGSEHDKRHGGQHDEREGDAQVQHGGDNERENQHISKDGDEAGREQIIEHVGVAGYTGDQAADRVAIVKCQVELLKALHHFAPEIEHGALAGVLHDVGLGELAHETGGEHTKI